MEGGHFLHALKMLLPTLPPPPPPSPLFAATDVARVSRRVQNIKVHAPYLAESIKAGKDARHLWFALKRWGGEDPERFFGELGSWAEARMKEMEGGGPK